MRISVVLEHRFIHTADGATYDDGQAVRSHWQRYFQAFEAVQIVARSRLVPEVPAGYSRVDGPGISVLHIPPYHGPAGLLRRLPTVTATLLRGIPAEDAVIVRLSGVLGHLAAALRHLRGQSFAVEVVNNPHMGYGPDGTRHPLRPLFRWLLTSLTRLHCRQADAVQYVTREALQRLYPARPGVPSYGVSDVHLPPQAFRAAPRRYTAPARQAVLVGQLEQRHKAADIAIAALARLRRRGHDLHLTIVGGGPLRPELERQAADLGVADAVTFTGQRSSPTAVRDDLNAADLFLIPSRTEGLPRVLLEAMAQGLPAIGSTVGGIPELLAADCLVPPGDAGALAERWEALAFDPARLGRESARNHREALGYADDLLDAKRTAFQRAVRQAARRAAH